MTDTFYGPHEVKISIPSAMRLKTFMKEELAYYNALLNTLSAYYHRDQKILRDLTDQQIEIFGLVAKTGFRASNIRIIRGDVVLPPELEKHRSYLTEKVSGKRILTESFIYLLEAAASPAAISTGTRYYMAREMLRYFINLSKAPDRDHLKAPLKILELLDDSRKRHLQIHRSCMEIVWDEEQGVSLITIPYISEPLVLPFNVSRVRFTSLIIKQVGRDIPSPTTPWEVELITRKNEYMLGYQDNSNPYLASSKFRYARKVGG